MLKNHCFYLLLCIGLLGNAQQDANQTIETKVVVFNNNCQPQTLPLRTLSNERRCSEQFENI